MFTLHVKVAAACYRHALKVLFVWAALLVIAGHGALQLPELVKGHGLTVENGSYTKAQRILESDFGIPAEPVIVFFERDDQVSQSAFNRFIDDSLGRLRGVDGLIGVVTPHNDPAMRKGTSAYAILQFRQPSYALQSSIAELRQRLPADQHMKARLTGQAVVQADVNRASRRDLQRAELIGLPIAFLILRFAFGGTVAALLPVAVGASATAGAMGIASALSDRLDWSVFVLNVMPMVGLALGLDFALVIVSRFREELRRHASRQALAVTMLTSGTAVVISAVCVLIGLAGIMLLRLPIFTTVALAAMVTVALSLLLAITLLPALLAVAEPCAGPTLPVGARKARFTVWERGATVVMRRPLHFALFACAVLGACMLPLADIRLTVPDSSSLPRSYESRQAAEKLAAGFSSRDTSLIYVIAELPDTSSWGANAAYAVAALAARLQADPLVLHVDSAPAAAGAGLAADRLPPLLQRRDASVHLTPAQKRFVHGNRTLLVVTLAVPAHSQQARNWVRRLEKSPFNTAHAAASPQSPRQFAAGAQASLTEPVQLTIGGQAKYEQELFDVINGRLPYAAGVIITAMTIVLLLAFRSVIIPIKTTLMHVMTLGAAFGLLVAICQQGRFGLEPSDIALMIPVFVFGLVFGISMDYGVFLLARIAEEYRRTGDNEASVRIGLASTSRIITSAAAILIAVTAPFASADVAGVRQLGIGIAAAVALDATIVRLILVPSLMKLLGRGNWWWPFQRRTGL